MNRARLFEDQKGDNSLPDVRDILSAQLSAALADGEEHIAKSLEALIAILMGLDELENRSPGDRDLVISLKNYAGELVQQLQFFDAHSQRVTHVAEAITASARDISMSGQQNNRYLDDLRKRYTCEAEHEVHQSMMCETDSESCSSPLEGD